MTSQYFEVYTKRKKMNKERHDILYNQARNLLNYSVKKVWFNINPYFEKREKDEQDLRNFEPRQSIILCEKLKFNGWIDRNELQADEFWDFLYSDKWNHGCSLRILQGQLFDRIQTQLHKLLKKQKIGQRQTFAIARNKRAQRECYTPANQKGYEEIEETLLLEFTYYGRLPDTLRLYKSPGSSHQGTTSGMTPQRSSETEADFVSLIRRRASTDRKVLSLVLPPFKNYQSVDVTKRTARKKWSTLAKRIKSPQRRRQMRIRQPPESSPKRTSNISSDTDYRYQPPLTNLKHLRCTEKAEYGIDTVWQEVSLKENVLDLGDEFYLSDIWKEREKQTHADYESASKKLVKCKIDLRKKKEEKEEREILSSEKTSCLPLMPSFNIEKIDINKTMPRAPIYNFRFPEVPSFEELVDIILESEECDESCSTPLRKKVADRHDFINLQQSFKKRRVTMGKLKSASTGGKKDAIGTKGHSAVLRTLSPAAAVSQKKTHILAPISEEDIDTLAAKVKGVTNSRKCEIHVHNYIGKIKGSKEIRRSKMKSVSFYPTNIPIILLTSPSGKISNLSDVATFSTLKKYVRKKVKPRKKNKARPVQEKDDLSMSSAFDTHKLNLQYSLERMDNIVKKRPEYYDGNGDQTRDQLMIPEDSVSESRGMPQLGRIKPPFGIRRSKTSLFQQKERKPVEQMGMPKITEFSPVDFEEKLLQSLGDFLVRKEHVVSNINGKSLTTITFTKKSVFHEQKYNHL